MRGSLLSSSRDRSLGAELKRQEYSGLHRSLRVIESAHGGRVTFAGHSVLRFSSNNYLGLASHPRIKEAANAAIKDYGLGAGASRLVAGTGNRCVSSRRTLRD